MTPPGEATPDWAIVARIARAAGCRGYEVKTAEEVWDEYRAVTRDTNCDQFGMTNGRLRQGPLQWYCPDQKHPGTQRRYAKGHFHTDCGRASFVTVAFRHGDETTTVYPLALTTGRIASQWHTRTRTRRVPELKLCAVRVHSTA